MHKEYKIEISEKSDNFVMRLKEIWAYRQLLYIFAWRDIKVRYKQTFLGILWVLFQPLASAAIFTIFFGQLAKIPSGDLPYGLFVLIGLVFWGYFSNVLSQSSYSLVANESIIKKAYFPREILPLASIFVGLIDFLIAFAFLLALSFYFGYYPELSIFYLLPIVMLISSLAAVGGGFFLSALNVKYRDVRNILPFFISIMIYLTPVIYPSSILSSQNRIFLAMNPMTGVIDSMRKTFEGKMPDWQLIWVSLLFSTLMLVVGLIYFRRTEKEFADLA